MEKIINGEKTWVGSTIGFSISREDYFSLPDPLDADKLTDEEMNNLAECIDEIMCKHYRFNRNDLKDFVENPISLEERKTRVFNKISEAFWIEMEENALAFGMTYFDE